MDSDRQLRTHVIVHCNVERGDFYEYDGLILDWDRNRGVSDTHGEIDALISIPSGYGPEMKVVKNVRHFSKLNSATFWRWPDEPVQDGCVRRPEFL